MLEPYEIGEKLGAAIGHGVIRLLIGFGFILTSAMLFGVIAMIASQTGHIDARNAAILTLAFTVMGYSLQLRPRSKILDGLVLGSVAVSWITGIAAVGLIVFGG